MTHTLNPTWLHRLVRQYQTNAVWPTVQDVLPALIFEVMALGESGGPTEPGLIWLGLITAKVRLDDGHPYKLRYDHPTHVIQLCRMTGQRNGPPVATFTNQTAQEDIWMALHPRAAAIHGAQARAAAKGHVFIPLASSLPLGR